MSKNFNAIYVKRGPELLDQSDVLDSLSDAFEFAPNSRAARDTELIRLLVLQSKLLMDQVDRIIDGGLYKVWDEMERFHGGDIGRDDMVTSITDYELKMKGLK